MRRLAILASAAALLTGAICRAQEPTVRMLDLGIGPAATGYAAQGTEGWTAARGYGWATNPGLMLRDRGTPDPLRRDFVYGTSTAVFRLSVVPGTYRLTLLMGDMEFGNHVLAPSVNVDGVSLPVMTATVAEFATLTVAFEVTGTTLEVTCASPQNNWVLNALTLEPADAADPPALTRQSFSGQQPSKWGDVASWPDPTAPLLARYRSDLATARPIRPTGLNRADYLAVIAGNVDHFKAFQDADGAILDPHKGIEWQYSTPAFAHAAILLVDQAGRADLLGPATKAMDWAVRSLAASTAPQNHEDFFAPMLAHALPLFEKHAPPAVILDWKARLSGFNPYTTYTAGVGGGNWNVVALSGEALFHLQGLRSNPTFTEDSLAVQGQSFTSRWGLYLEGPMAYDHFPRLWAADMLAHGYQGRDTHHLAEALRRASLTSLFMQSPTGELPTGGRSAHHQWNEAEQCVTYEIYAKKALDAGDAPLAAAFKRAAHLALASMKRWIRPSGEMWIVKNRFDPSIRFGYEGYSAHSQYNLLPMSMLAIAWEHAGPTEHLAEVPAPADVGGFVFQIDPKLHKVFANAGGMYVEIDTNADAHYNATGLQRVHRTGADPQIGPSDSLTTQKSYSTPATPAINAAVGIYWKDASGAWMGLADFSGSITSAVVSDVFESPDRVSFRVTYNGAFSGPQSVVEAYALTPNGVTVTYALPGYGGPARVKWPVLVENGRSESEVSILFDAMTVQLEGARQEFRPLNASALQLGAERYAGRNGWYRLGLADFAAPPATLRIVPVVPWKLADGLRALRIAAGLAGASAADLERLKVDPIDDGVTLAGALHIMTSVID